MPPTLWISGTRKDHWGETDLRDEIPAASQSLGQVDVSPVTKLEPTVTQRFGLGMSNQQR